MPSPCSICTIGQTDPKRLDEINAALVEHSTGLLAVRMSLSQSALWRHFVHTPGLREKRRAFLDEAKQRAKQTAKAKDAARAPVPLRDPEAPTPPPDDGKPPGPTPAAPRKRRPPGPGSKRHIVAPPGGQKVKGRGSTISVVSREAYAVQLRQKGFTYPQIAEKMGLLTGKREPDVRRAYLLVMDAYERFQMIGAESAAEARAIECSRYDHWTQVLSEQLEPHVMVDGTRALVDAETQHRAIHLLLGISKERKKILGLDVPRAIALGQFAPGFGGGGLHKLPPVLAMLDPPPTDEELEHYVATGEIPARGNGGRDGLDEMRDEMRRRPREHPERDRAREARARASLETTAEAVPEPETPPLPGDPDVGPLATPNAPPDVPEAPEPPASARGPLGAGEATEGWWKKAGGGSP